HTRFSRDWSSDVCSSDLTASQTQNRKEGDNAWRPHLNLYAKLNRSAATIAAGQDRNQVLTRNYQQSLNQIFTIRRPNQPVVSIRSEERRVGKESRTQWWT